MNKTKAVIIEDEKPAARLLGSMINSLRPGWNVEILPGSIESSVEWFRTHEQPDLIFLDIRLSDGNSFLFLEKAKPASAIIFTTAYDEYAVRAFTVNSIDYLLKPIKMERLEDAIAKYESMMKRNYNLSSEKEEITSILKSLSQPGKKFRSRFLIYGIDRLITLNVEDIAYFYSENRITSAVTHSGKEYALELSLDKLMEQLDPDRFFRTNRQTIVNIDAITNIEPYFRGKLLVYTKPHFADNIYVSKEKSAAFKVWLNY